MAFFENIGNGIKNVGNTLKSGAEDLGRKAQLNAEIGKIQKDINLFYTQLGEETYRNLSAEEADRTDVQPIIDNLNGAFAAIREREEELARIEAEAKARKEEEENRKRREAEERVAAAAAVPGVCEKCGAALLPDGRFCVQCGAPVPQPEPVPEEKVCPYCGAHASADAKFCVECGTKLDETP